MKGWRTVPEGGASYFPCVCGENLVTMQQYYEHMDFCMTEKRADYMAAIHTAITEGSRGERIEDLLEGDSGESWNTPSRARAMSFTEWLARLRVLQDKAMDEQTIIFLVPQGGERGGSRTLKP